MENKDLQVRTFLNANGTPFYPKTRWSAIVDAPDIEATINNILEEGSYVSDANYVHTDNNFTDVLKEKLDGLRRETFQISGMYRNSVLTLDNVPSIRELSTMVSQCVVLTAAVLFADVSSNDIRFFHLKEFTGSESIFSHIENKSSKVIESEIKIYSNGTYAIAFKEIEIPEPTKDVVVVRVDLNGTTFSNASHSYAQLIEHIHNGDVVLLELRTSTSFQFFNLIRTYRANSVETGPLEFSRIFLNGYDNKSVNDVIISLSQNNTWGYSEVYLKIPESINDFYPTYYYQFQDGDTLRYDGSRWQVGNFDELPSQTGNNGKFLTTNGSSASWSDIGLSNISDIYIDNLSNNQILKYNSSQQRWENAANTAASAISQLTDVELTNLADGQILKYSSQDSKWVNATGGSGSGVQSDWNETDTDDPAYIKNKPTIPSGTVTSVGVSVPTGLSVSGTPVTSSGIIAISLASGYSIPATEKQGEWDAKQSAIDSTHKLSADYIEDGTTNKVINVKPDWNAASGNVAEILNKPAIHNIPAGGNAGQVLKKTSATDYDVNWANASETLPSAYCTTSGSTAAKKANCSLYVTQANQYLQVLIGSANTYQGALTLNINSAGAKPIYINGLTSSSSNYTLPNGTYFVFYDGTNYYFRTDGKLPMKSADFSGSYTELADKPTIPTITFKQW